MEDNSDDKTVVPIERANGKFVKGQSGNPGGRKAKSAFIRAASGNRYLIEDLLMHEAPFVIHRLLKLVSDPDTPPTAVVAAGKVLLEHALGKPITKVVTARADDDADVVDLQQLDTETIRKVASVKAIDRKED